MNAALPNAMKLGSLILEVWAQPSEFSDPGPSENKSVRLNTFHLLPGNFPVGMNPFLAPGPFRAFRRDGKLVIEIDEHRFCADAFLQSESRILDRDAFLAFACENLFEVLHDASAEERTWWTSFAQAIGQSAADAGAGVRLNDGGEDRLAIDQQPELFPDDVTRELLGAHVKQVALSA